MGSTLRRRDFTLLWAGQAVSQLGSRTYGVAYMLLVLAETGSPARVGVLASVMLATMTVARFPSGWIADRLDRRLVMVACDAASAVAVLSVTAVVSGGGFSFAHMVGAGIVLSVGWAVRPTAEFVSIPNVVEPDEVRDATILLQARSYATGLAGPVLAGTLFAVAPVLPFLVDGVSYLVSLGCSALIRRPLRTAGPVPTGRILPDIADGFRAFWHNRFVRTTALLGTAGDFVIAAVGFTVIILLGESDVGSAGVGIVVGMGMGGGLLGSAITPFISRRFAIRPVLVAAPASAAVAAIGLVAMRGVLAIGIAYAGVFLLRPAYDALVEARWLSDVPEEIRGRVDAAASMVSSVANAGVPVVMGVALSFVGARPAIAGLAVASAAVAVATVGSRTIRADRAAECLESAQVQRFERPPSAVRA